MGRRICSRVTCYEFFKTQNHVKKITEQKEKHIYYKVKFDSI